ncbi:MAG: arylsulfatase [Verrucomicrobiota bacterium]
MRFWIYLSSLVCITAAAFSKSPHIVFVLLDDMGYGDIGAFNPDSKIKTPRMDELAAEGKIFTDAHAPGPLCHMSRYGLLTGRYPFRTDVSVWRNTPLIDEDQVTIASLLKSRGYSTSMVGKWHLGFHEGEDYTTPLHGGPVDRGFDSFFGIRASTDIPPYFYIRGREAVAPPTDRIEARGTDGWTRIQGEFIRAGGIAPDLKLEDVLPRFTDEAIQVIESYKSGTTCCENPLMLYLAYPAPHTPWLPSEEYAGKSKVPLYGDFMMMVDAEIGRVLDTIESAGMEEDTLFILTSDNGPVWYPSDIERYGHDSVGGLRGMKSDAWEGGHRMPLILRWPAVIAGGSTSDQLVTFTDFLATFADLTHAALPEQAGPDSFSFIHEITGDRSKTTPVRQSAVMSSGSRGLMMIRTGDWKFIDGQGSGGFSERLRGDKDAGNEPDGQLYNLKEDLAESNNLFLQNPEKVDQLRREMKTIVNSPKSRFN